MHGNKKTTNQLYTERLTLLRHINDLTERPLLYLSFIWIGIVVLELTIDTSPALEYISYGIWILFILDFFLELAITPSTKKYLHDNWLLALSLLLPAFRIFRIFRSVRVLSASRSLRSFNLLKTISSLNRGVSTMRTVAAEYSMRYFFLLTIMIFMIGSAGIRLFESPEALASSGIPLGNGGIDSFGEAMWWTVMLMTTLGSDYWPHTTEGRILTVVLAVYSLAIFGYITATLASLLIGRRK